MLILYKEILYGPLLSHFLIYTSIYSLCLKNYIYKGIFRGLYIKLTIITNRYFLLV